MTIYQSNFAVERRQIRFPKSKKKRIRAKWRKREVNFTYIPKIYKMGDKLICHPAIYEKLKQDTALKENNIDWTDVLGVKLYPFQKEIIDNLNI